MIRVSFPAADQKQTLKQKKCVFLEDLLVSPALLKCFGELRKEDRASVQMLRFLVVWRWQSVLVCVSMAEYALTASVFAPKTTTVATASTKMKIQNQRVQFSLLSRR